MYMHLFTSRAGKPPADLKRDMLKTLGAIANYIVTDATDSELFTLSVAREVFASASASEIEQAIKKLRERGNYVP